MSTEICDFREDYEQYHACGACLQQLLRQDNSMPYYKTHLKVIEANLPGQAVRSRYRRLPAPRGTNGNGLHGVLETRPLFILTNGTGFAESGFLAMLLD